MNRRLRQLTMDVVHRHPVLVPVLTLLSLLNSLMDGIAMALLFPLLALAGIGGGTTSRSGLSRAIGGAFAVLGLPLTFGTAIGAVVGAVVVQNLVFLGQSWAAARLQNDYVDALRRRLWSALLHASWSFFMSRRAGQLGESAVTETVRVGGVIYLLNQLFANTLVVIAYAGVALLARWQLTLVLAVAGSLIFLLTHGVVRAGRRLGQQITHETHTLASLVQEAIPGIKLVKATNAEAYLEEMIDPQLKTLKRSLFLSSFQLQLVKAVFETLAVCALAGILAVGRAGFNVDATTVVVIIALFVRLYPKISSIQQNLQLLNVYTPAVGAVQDLLAAAEAAQERRTLPPPLPMSPAPASAPALPFGAPAIRVQDLRIEYDGRPALQGVSLAFAGGKTTGIVGRSGAGKSTLVDALLGLIEPTAGRILIGGIPLDRSSLAAWRDRIGYVPQEIVLFNASIRDNIRWNRQDATDAEIEAVAEMANASEFIDALPDRYDTVIGDRGARLSGGQRQRLGLARALVGDRSVLILDEATSALDSAAEQEIMRAIESLHGRMTIILIAHRLSTIKSADMIYVLDEGRIAESGSWQELISLSGRFSESWRLQSEAS